MLKWIGFIVLGFVAFIPHSNAQAKTCVASDRKCVIDQLIVTAETIENENWKDQTFREIAKSLAADGFYDEAIAVLDRIKSPDKKALSIRGIGMAIARNKVSGSQYSALFQTLKDKSEAIEHPPSYAIALTYIAMAQAFADDDQGAWETAASMDNDALRFKAYGETAEIQAERGDVAAAMKSVSYIDSVAFRNKAYALVSKLLADKALFDDALKAAEPLTNAYKKASALQYILDKQAASLNTEKDL